MTAVFELGVAQVAVWWVAATALIGAWWVTFGGQHRNPRHDRQLGWWLWHWFTGGPLETARSYPGGGGRPRRVLRRVIRAAGRTTLTAGFAAAVYLRSGAPDGTGLRTVTAWGAAGAGFLAVVPVVAAHVSVRWSMWRHYIRPLHWAVAGAAGWDLDLRPWQVHRYIKIRRGLATAIDGVIIVCGPTFEPRDEKKKKVVEIVKAKLGLSDVSTQWTEEGIHRYVQFRAQEPVPAKVPFTDPEIRTLIEEESTPGKVLLGMSRGDKPVWLDMDDKAPHVLMSAGTGGGKTAALVAIVAQLMWHGAKVVVLDYKRISHLWLRDLAGVRYARDISEIHRTALDLGAEVARRTTAWDPVTFDQKEAGQGPKFPRLVIVCEEMSSTMDELRDYWSDIRESSDPTRSPAVTALAKVLNMGREVRMNVLTVAQRAEANAVGNGAMRENYPVKILIDRYSKQTWNILAPQCDYKPGVSHAGRAQVCLGPDSTETQMLWFTQRDAQRWVIDKRGMQPIVRVPVPADAVSPGETVGEPPLAGNVALPGGVPAVTLWEASKDNGRGVLDMKYDALKTAARGDREKGEFPEPVGKRGRFPEYDPRDLQRWEKNRPRRKVSDEVAGGTNETDGVGRVDDRTNESLAERVPVGGWLQPSDSLRERFEAQVDRSDSDGCHRWTGAVNGDGYPYFKVDGRAVPAHRVAYELGKGPIPEGLTIDHLCGTKACQNVDHLEAVTNEQNVERRWERQRAQEGATS